MVDKGGISVRNFRLWFSGHKKGIKTAAIIVWGILLALIAAYIVIGCFLGETVYFHPAVTEAVNVLVLIAVWIVPLCVIIWKIVKRYSGAGAVLWNVLAAVGIACGAIVINALVVFNNGCLEGIFDDELYYRDGKVYLESDIWFSSDVNVEVYESENIFFVRLVDEYNRPASDEFAR